MAALTTNAAGTAFTPASATGGGDTIESSTLNGGQGQPILLVVTVGATPTTVTLDGVAGSSVTSQTVVYTVPNGVKGTRKNITYNQVSSVTVAAVQALPSNHYASYGN